MAKMGRPTNNPRTERIQIRFTSDEAAILRECTEKMQAAKTTVFLYGLTLVKEKLDKKNTLTTSNF